MIEKELESLDDVERDLVERAATLAQVKDATDKPAFTLLFNYFKEKAIKARNDLVAADPENPKQIRHLQNEVKRYEEIADVVRLTFIQAVQTVQQLDAYLGTASGDTEADQD